MMEVELGKQLPECWWDCLVLATRWDNHRWTRDQGASYCCMRVSAIRHKWCQCSSDRYAYAWAALCMKQVLVFKTGIPHNVLSSLAVALSVFCWVTWKVERAKGRKQMWKTERALKRRQNGPTIDIGRLWSWWSTAFTYCMECPDRNCTSRDKSHWVLWWECPGSLWLLKQDFMLLLTVSHTLQSFCQSVTYRLDKVFAVWKSKGQLQSIE